MAVTDVQQRDRPEATFELGKYTVRVPYRVTTNSISDGPFIVIAGSNLPSFYSPYVWGNEFNDEVRLVRYEPKPLGTPPTLTWIVECVYESPSPKHRDDMSRGGGTGRQTSGEFTNPLLEIPTVKLHSSGREAILSRIYDTDTGIFKPCTSTNGEVFDPPPKYLEPYATLEITRNESIGANQPGIALAYANAVNSDTFWGFGAGYWKMKDISPERQDRQVPNSPFKFPFLRVSYVAEFNPQTWDMFLLDYGTYYWTHNAADPGGVGNPQMAAQRNDIVSQQGARTAAPLNGKGQPLPDRLPCTFTDNSATITIAATTPQYNFQVDDIVQITGIQKPGEDGARAPSPFAFNTPYYVKTNSVVAGVQSIELARTQGGTAIIAGNPSNQRGWIYMFANGVFLQVRPYARLPFASLLLPQSFSVVQ